MVLKVIINESDTSNFIFDTGNVSANIDSATAERLKIVPFSTFNIHCASAIRIMPIAKCKIKIKDLVLNIDTLTIYSTNKISEDLGIPIKGLIGQNMFRSNVIKIDFEKNIIEVFNKSYTPNDNNYLSFNISKSLAIFTNINFLNNRVLYGSYIIDTGSGRDLVLSPLSVDSLEVKQMIGSYKKTFLTDMCSNEKMYYVGKVNCLKIRNLKLDSLKVALSTTTVGSLADNSFDGLIGLPVLKQFDIIIDYPRSKIFLKPNKFYKKA